MKQLYERIFFYKWIYYLRDGCELLTECDVLATCIIERLCDITWQNLMYLVMCHVMFVCLQG